MRGFIEAFLSYHGIKSRKMFVVSYPCGSGCGEAFVRREYPNEIRILQSTSYIRKVLIVCTDADKYDVKERERFLENEAKAVIPKWNRDIEPVIMWIPKRQIETWIRFLREEDVTEEMTFSHSGKPVSCKDEAERLALYCQDRIQIDDDKIRSIRFAKEEYIRVCKLQK